MTDKKLVRVAATQFATGSDLNANLKTALRMLDRAAKHQPDLVVLPEFCNHLSWYTDKAHCHAVSVALDGSWLEAIGDKAREHQMHVVINCTVQRESGRATGTSILFDRNGNKRAESDKQVCIGHENEFLRKATRNCPIVETEIGRLGMYACMDGVIFETPRGLALSGAQILCNSLNSFALDEASLHIPVRASENRVFVVAANKVGPLIPKDLLSAVSEQTSIPEHFLFGAGESQIVAPDGRVLAKASRDTEEVIFADVDPREANNKLRPDGTDLFRARRPSLYAPIGQTPPARRNYQVGAACAQAGVYQPKADGKAAIDEAARAIHEAGKAGLNLLTLPEMFCFEGGVTDEPAAAAERSERAVQALTKACSDSPELVVATSLVTKAQGELFHTGVLIDRTGVVLAQGALHRSERHPWSQCVDYLKIAALPFARTALVVGDDSLFPETFRLAALQDCELVAVPFSGQEAWESQLGLIERSAENRLCVVAATRPSQVAESLILTLWKDYTLMTPWETRTFDGHLSYPRITRAARKPGLTCATIHPAHAQNKLVSLGTNVVDGRPYALAQPLLR